MAKTRYNNYNSEKNYRKILFNPSTPLQSAELNEMQDIHLGFLERVGNFVVANGAIVKGGDIKSISTTNVQLAEGSVSVDGIPVYVPEGNILFPGAEGILENTIGIELQVEEITSIQDKDLLQPEPNSPFFGEPTADRLKITGKWVRQNDANVSKRFIPVMIVANGQVLTYCARDFNKDYVSSSIASYDRGVHGSYVLDGLTVRYRDDLETQFNPRIPIEVGSGTVRVNGIELKFTSSQVMSLDPIVADFKEVSAEPISFVANQSSYTLRNQPPKSITRVIGTKQVTEEVTRGSYSGGEDVMPHAPVLKILEVKVGSTIYSQGADFTQVGDKISWAPNGNEPSPGTQYTVTYQYQHTFNASIASNKLQIAQQDVQNLVNGSTLSITYDYYLCRMDRLVATQEGQLKILKGVPDTAQNIFPPSIDETTQLSLAIIKVAYGTSPKINQDDTVYMVPFKTMKRMNDDIRDIQYNLLQLSLKDQAREMDPVTNKRGIITDPLANENMRDKGIAKYNNAVISNATLSTGISYSLQKPLNENNITLDVQTETIYRSQLVKTGSVKINPYARPDTAPKGDMKATPSIIYGNMWDEGFDGDYLPFGTTVKLSLSGFGNAEQVRLKFRGKDLGTVSTDNKGTASYTLSVEANTPYSDYAVNATGLVSKTTASSVITIRKNDESFSRWQNNRNLSLLADAENRLQSQIDANRSSIDQLAQQLAQEVERARKSEQSLQNQIDELKRQQKAAQNAFDDFERKWKAGQVHDQRERDRLRNELNAINGRVNQTNTQLDTATRNLNNRIDQLNQAGQGNTRFGGDHPLLTAQIVARRTGVSVRQLANGVIEFYDPIAQTFTTKAVTNVSAVEVEVTAKPTKDLICKLVEVTAGQPDIYKLVAYAKIPVANVVIGMNKLVFEDIAQLEANKDYAFVIITDSFEGEVAIAKVGEFDENRIVVHEQPDIDGTFFKSSNERTWTAYQDTDMKYKIYQVAYQNRKEVKIGTVKAAERQDKLTDFKLVGNVSNNPGTGVEFYLKINNVKFPIALNKTLNLQGITKAKGDIEIWAILTSSSPIYTPTIFSGLVFLAGNAITPSYYCSRQFEIREGRTKPAKLQIVLDQRVPLNTNLEVSYQSGATDENWTTIPKKLDSERYLGENWVEVIYETPSANVNFLASRLRLKLETSHFENRPEIRNIRILVI